MVCGDPGRAEYGSPEILFAPKKPLGFLFTRFSKKPKQSNEERIDIELPRFSGQLGGWQAQLNEICVHKSRGTGEECWEEAVKVSWSV